MWARAKAEEANNAFYVDAVQLETSFDRSCEWIAKSQGAVMAVCESKWLWTKKPLVHVDHETTKDGNDYCKRLLFLGSPGAWKLRFGFASLGERIKQQVLRISPVLQQVSAVAVRRGAASPQSENIHNCHGALNHERQKLASNAWQTTSLVRSAPSRHSLSQELDGLKKMIRKVQKEPCPPMPRLEERLCADRPYTIYQYGPVRRKACWSFQTPVPF